MRSATPTTSASYFLGVRLSREELDALDRFQTAQHLRTRSDAVRALARRGDVPAAEGGLALPVSVRAELEELVEDGWARTVDEAVTLAVSVGVHELARLHGERIPALRRAARELAGRAERRRRADRQGRELLDR